MVAKEPEWRSGRGRTVRRLIPFVILLCLGVSNLVGVSWGTLVPEARAATATPMGFNLSSPYDLSSSESTMPTFYWGYSSSDATYTLEISKSAGFTKDVIDQAGLTSTSYSLTTALSPGVVYYWRVEAQNAGGAVYAANGPFEFSAPIVAGSGLPGSLAITPDGTRALVALSSNGKVKDISLTSHRVLNTIVVGSYPAGVAIRSDGLEAVVANSLGSTGHGVSVLDLTNDTVKSTISVPCASTTLYDVAYTPDGSQIVLPDLDSSCTVDGLRVITVATQSQSFIDLGLGSSDTTEGVAVMPNGDSALVTLGLLGASIRRVNLGSQAVSTISTVTATAGSTGASFGVAVTPDSTQAVVSSGESDTLKRIDLATNSVVKDTAFSSNQSFHNVAITPDGNYAVVVGDFSTGLLSLKTDSIVVQYPDGGSNVAISPDGTRAYISAYDGSNTVLRVIALPVSSGTSSPNTSGDDTNSLLLQLIIQLKTQGALP